MDAVYRLNIKAIWQRLRQEPLHFWLFCGYIFFEYVRPQTIYSAIDILPWTQIFLLGSLLAVFFDRRETKEIKGPLTFPVLGFFFVVFVSCVFAFSPAQSLDQIDVLLNWVLVYLLFLWSVNSRFRLFIVFLILLLASFKMAQHGFRVSAGRGFGFARWGVGGPSGWFQNAADLGVQMTIYTAWALAFYFGLRKYWHKRWLRWLIAFFPIAGLVTALATNQRNTVIAFAVMAMAFLLFSKNRFRNAIVVLVTALALNALAPQEFKDRFINMSESGTALTRLDYWERGLEFYQDNPVLGVGYNNYTLYYAANYPGDVNLKGRVAVAHSLPVTMLAETGTIGMIFFCWVALALFVINIRSARILRGQDPPFWYFFALSLNYGLLGFLTASVFLSIAYYPFLWVQAGLSASLWRIASSGRERVTVSRRASWTPGPRILGSHETIRNGQADRPSATRTVHK